ncbi:hypothetical protein BJ508DRAFT_325774 [Ascobolus immersus RN42]|uniref:Uncharacterized protein n=1 Tax=Ascobolus immersus RN42 TaxID=1160509 RepID=A0A3N4I827_ASCIM|nr:hypothetical protein BJ508DRAFT_325774 [Ascobolus immersus RN42]
MARITPPKPTCLCNHRLLRRLLAKTQASGIQLQLIQEKLASPTQPKPQSLQAQVPSSFSSLSHLTNHGGYRPEMTPSPILHQVQPKETGSLKAEGNQPRNSASEPLLMTKADLALERRYYFAWGTLLMGVLMSFGDLWGPRIQQECDGCGSKNDVLNGCVLQPQKDARVPLLFTRKKYFREEKSWVKPESEGSRTQPKQLHTAGPSTFGTGTALGRTPRYKGLFPLLNNHRNFASDAFQPTPPINPLDNREMFLQKLLNRYRKGPGPGRPAHVVKWFAEAKEWSKSGGLAGLRYPDFMRKKHLEDNVAPSALRLYNKSAPSWMQIKAASDQKKARSTIVWVIIGTVSGVLIGKYADLPGLKYLKKKLIEFKKEDWKADSRISRRKLLEAIEASGVKTKDEVVDIIKKF